MPSEPGTGSVPAADVASDHVFPFSQLPTQGDVGTLSAVTLIETDARSRVVLPGHPNQKFLVQENSDGSILLLPARVVTEAQLEYDENAELRDLLARAAASKTVRKSRRRSA